MIISILAHVGEHASCLYIIGVSLSEPQTNQYYEKITVLMYVCMYVCMHVAIRRPGAH